MVRIIKTEFYKLKRYHILWAGVASYILAFLFALLTMLIGILLKKASKTF